MLVPRCNQLERRECKEVLVTNVLGMGKLLKRTKQRKNGNNQRIELVIVRYGIWQFIQRKEISI